MSYEQYAYTKYNREVKKLSESIREKVVEVQEEIAEKPFQGKPLKGELKGWRTYPFSHAGSSYRIAYKIEEETERVIFGSVGTREGFYEDLKNS